MLSKSVYRSRIFFVQQYVDVGDVTGVCWLSIYLCVDLCWVLNYLYADKGILVINRKLHRKRQAGVKAITEE